MQDKPNALMIFAAGRGTRMAPLTDTRPKPLIEIGETTLLDHALALADGIKTVVVNTHYLAEQITRHVASKDVITVFEPELLETGGGLRNALPCLGAGPVFCLNSDAIWRGPNVLNGLTEAWDSTRMEALLSVVPPERARGHPRAGDFSLARDLRLARGGNQIFTGAQITKTERLMSIPDKVFSMNVLWDQMIAAKTLFGQPYDGHWCDVGQPSSIPMAESLLHV